MIDPFTNCFTFLHRNTRFLLNHNPIRRRRRTPNRSLFSSNSFMEMGVSNQFKQVFKLIDTNGDGKISASELSEVLVCLGHTTKKGSAAKEAEGIVRVLDFNGDGFVDLDEFMVVMNGSLEAKNNGSHVREEEELMDAFLIFDCDRNGLISAKELRRVLVNLGWTNCSLRECKRMIQGVDKNGDGFVDFDEFRSMMRSSSNGVSTD